MAQGEGGGRPLKFKSVKTLQKKIDAYFAKCDPHWIQQTYWEHPEVEVDESLEEQPHGGALKRKRIDYNADMVEKTRMILTDQKPYTITGLALALDTTRDTLLDYEHGNRDLKADDPLYDPDVPKFSDTIKRAKLKCQNYAEEYLYQGKNVAGAIFNLTNNHKWVNKTVNEDNGEKKFIIETRKHKRTAKHADSDED